MSFVDNVYIGVNFKRREVIKLLDDPVSWELIDRGGSLEKFRHSSGWYFYTGQSMCTIYNKSGGFNIELCLGLLTFVYFNMTKKEEKFVKAWLKANKDKSSE